MGPRVRMWVTVAIAAVVIAILAGGLPAASSRLGSTATAARAPMVLTFNTALDRENSLWLPLSGGSVTINWGDGTSSTGVSHTYASPGIYKVSISGTATRFGYDRYPWYQGLYGITAVSSFGDLGLKDLSSAFATAVNLTSVPATLPASVTNMAGMFTEAVKFNGRIGTWNTSHVTNMAGMFYGTTAFNQPIGGWDTSHVTNMAGMFYQATAFNQPIGRWNTSRVTDMHEMFVAASSFNQPLGAWNTRTVTTMRYMFVIARAFNQPIGNWNTSRVKDMTSMFHGAGLSISNYNQLLIGWGAKPQVARVHLDAGTSQYNDAAVAARRRLTSHWGWTITDAGHTHLKAVPQITLLPQVGPVRYPKALTNANVRGGAANTRGRFVLATSPLYLKPGLQRVRVIFRPTDTAHYTSTATVAWVRVYPRG
jgi:surface protein